jgi:urea transporter
MLQNNVITGLLLLIGIFYNSMILGVGALIGVLLSTITAFVLNYDIKKIYSGLYGFNGALVGLALLFFFEINTSLIILVVIGSILSPIIMNFIQKKKIPPYTFPFIITTWSLMALINHFNLTLQKTQELITTYNLNLISSLSMGFGQVMFQTSIITSFIFLIAIVINSRISAVYALIGSFIGVVIPVIFSFPLNLINLGIYGFNGVLCGLVFANKKKSSLFYAISSITLSVFIIHGVIALNLVALTAPFVFSTWIILALRKFAVTS